jgi:hypothetical protein
MHGNRIDLIDGIQYASPYHFQLVTADGWAMIDKFPLFFSMICTQEGSRSGLKPEAEEDHHTFKAGKGDGMAAGGPDGYALVGTDLCRVLQTQRGHTAPLGLSSVRQLSATDRCRFDDVIGCVTDHLGRSTK